ncbi:MAG: TIGR02221 family CRISPR-associated protein [Chloroflexota bacterium]
MRRIITFLGIRPVETWYEYRDRVVSARVFPEALSKLVDFDVMNVLLTEEARRNSYPVLAELKEKRISPEEIPDGRNQEEMWQIFTKVTDLVEEGDVVAFDITHGLRSIPFLVFLAAAFLRSARRVTIEAVYYGAYELGDMRADPVIPAPVIDLTEFIDLLEWMQAAAHFEATGNGLPLAELIKGTRDPALQKTASALRATTQGLRLGLATQVGQSVAELVSLLKTLPQHARPAAAPVQVLVEHMANKYEPLALDETLDVESAPRHLRQQAALIAWYVDNDLALQAWLLAREWLVTWVAMERGERDLLHKDARARSEQMLNDIMRGERTGARPEDEAQAKSARMDARGVRELEPILTLWSQTVGVRNELAHMSMRVRSRKGGEVVRRLRQIKKSISAISERHLPLSPQEELSEWNPWAGEE